MHEKNIYEKVIEKNEIFCWFNSNLELHRCEKMVKSWGSENQNIRNSNWSITWCCVPILRL